MAIVAGSAVVACGLAIGGSVGIVRAYAAGHLYDEASVPATDVGVVLGAQVYPNGQPSPFLAARLDLAKRLYDAGKIKVILVSGDNMAKEYDEPTAMQRYLIAQGVPANKVVLDYAGFDTYDTCSRAKRIFGVTELTVVTQSYHLPRAVATCRMLGLTANGVGDSSVKTFGGAWTDGSIRDQVACVKTMIDVISRRDPVLGRAEDGVRIALAS